MNKKLALLAGASVLLLGAPTLKVAYAQDASGPFADVPADHWAYQAVDTLQKAGIVIGYPDKTYGGKRAMTRYEFAVAIARLLPLIPQQGNYATQDQINGLRADEEAKIANNAAAIDALKQLVNGFQTELEALGQNVADINKRLDALESRVAVLEEENKRIHITGIVTTIGRADAASEKDGSGDYTFVDKNGVNTGSGRPPAFNSSGSISSGVVGSKKILQASDVYNDFLLTIKGKVSDTATANVKLDFGNYLDSLGNTDVAGMGYPAGGGSFGSLFGSFFGGGTGSGLAPGGTTAANQTTTVWEAYLDAPVSLGPLGGAELVVGRFPNQFTKYTLQQVDADVYTSLYQTDSGNIPTDGGKVNFKVGPVGVQAFAGKFSAIPEAQPYAGNTLGSTTFIEDEGLAHPNQLGSIDGGQSRPLGTIFQDHGAPIVQGAGVRATVGAPEGAVLGGVAETFALGDGGLRDPINHKSYTDLTVFEGDFNGALPFLKSAGLTLDANYAITENGGGNNNTGEGYRHQETDDQLGVTFGALSLKGGYQYVGPEYTAPGYWGKIGSWTNPTNIKGGVVSGKYAFSSKLHLDADAEFYKAAYGDDGDGKGTVNSPLGQDDKLNHYQVGLGYGLSSAYSVDLGYERVEYNLKNKAGYLNQSGDPVETYVTLGIGHPLNKNASVKLEYQFVDYYDRGTGFDPNGNSHGGVAVGQFQLKF